MNKSDLKKENKNLWLANMVLSVIRFGKVCKDDIDFALKYFIDNNEYEKCAILKELLDNNYFDDKIKNQVKSYEEMIEILFELESLKNTVNELKNELNDTNLNKIRGVVDVTKNMMDDVDLKDKIFNKPKIVYPPLSKKNLSFYKKFLKEYVNDKKS